LDLIFNNHFSRDEPGLFEPLRETLLGRGDYFMHLADLTSYAEAQQRVGESYADQTAWSRMAVRNVACSGKFSSDRAIKEYADEIWNAKPCPIS
jgi:starch phosphorylase